MQELERFARDIEEWAFSLRSCQASLGSRGVTDTVAWRVSSLVESITRLPGLEGEAVERVRTLLQEAIAAFESTGDRITTARLLQQSARQLRKASRQEPVRAVREHLMGTWRFAPDGPGRC